MHGIYTTHLSICEIHLTSSLPSGILSVTDRTTNEPTTDRRKKMAQEWMHLVLADAFGRVTHIRREMQPHVLLAEYQAEIDNYITTLEAVSDLGVVRADFYQTGLGTPSDPAATANVDVGATFSGWAEATPGKKLSTKLPGIQLAKVDAQGNVDLTDVDIVAFLSNYADAGDFYISDGENVAADGWVAGKLDR